MSDTTVEPPKRAYSTPTLVTYGDVASLTQNRAGGMLKDGGKGFKSRTR